MSVLPYQTVLYVQISWLSYSRPVLVLAGSKMLSITESNNGQETICRPHSTLRDRKTYFQRHYFIYARILDYLARGKLSCINNKQTRLTVQHPRGPGNV
jgi:hypothetical protein